MIIMIVFLSITVIFFIAFIIAIKINIKTNVYEAYEACVPTGCLFGVFFCISIALGITCLMAKTNNACIRCNKMELENKIEYLNATKEMLENSIDSSLTSRPDIISFNEEVKELKYTIEKKHIDLNNPAINWFVEYYWVDYSADCVSYIR